MVVRLAHGYSYWLRIWIRKLDSKRIEKDGKAFYEFLTR